MKKDMDFYISMGFEPRMAEYFASGRKVLMDVKPYGEYKLLLIYDNEERVLDLKDMISKGTVFEFLLLPENFNRVYIDENNNVCWDKDTSIDSKVHWNNKIDISADTCYVDSVRV